MKHSKQLRYPPGSAATIASVLLLAAPLGAVAQSGSADHPRTAWGVPDISGVYAEYTTAPLQRPEEFGDREFLTDEEFSELERRRTRPLEINLETTTTPGTAADVHYNFDQFALGANEGVSSPNRRTFSRRRRRLSASSAPRWAARKASSAWR